MLKLNCKDQVQSLLVEVLWLLMYYGIKLSTFLLQMHVYPFNACDYPCELIAALRQYCGRFNENKQKVRTC